MLGCGVGYDTSSSADSVGVDVGRRRILGVAEVNFRVDEGSGILSCNEASVCGSAKLSSRLSWPESVVTDSALCAVSVWLLITCR